MKRVALLVEMFETLGKAEQRLVFGIAKVFYRDTQRDFQEMGLPNLPPPSIEEVRGGVSEVRGAAKKRPPVHPVQGTRKAEN